MNEAFRHFVLKTKDEAVSVSEFVREALFSDKFGYYKKGKKRVGKSGDFYTASSLSPKLFSALLKEAFFSLAKSNIDGFESENFGFCEIGAEPELNLFENSKVLRLGDAIGLSGNLFVFSNELLDAQPFDRFYFGGGEVLKQYCRFSENGKVELFFREAPDFEKEFLRGYFGGLDGGFILDFSFEALDLLKKICRQNWKGVLIFADYFRAKEELLSFERGTARSYFRHAASSDIFSNIGECDITFSPAVEPLLDILKGEGFSFAECSAQGSFFMKNSQNEIRRAVETGGVFSPEKRALAELLTPPHMGESFKILSAARF
ncbi:MAG: SAM-dependent methyltransferase [Opitutales bacterium]|nr:SAM-dependent methyltransferase [Opitutales bacterium]